MPVYQLPRPPEEPAHFCRTPAAKRMLHVIELAMDMAVLGTIITPPGGGKTTTLLYFAESTPGACYAVMNPTHNSMTAMLAAVCEALDCRPTKSNADTHDIICRAIEWGRAKVLLVDEAQHLTDRCLDQLRCIYDEAGVPVVFAGNATLRDRFDGGKRAAFAQLTSRIGPRLELTSTTAADVGALAGHYGIADREAVSWLKKRCTGTGGLRMATHLMKLGAELAGKDAARLSHLKEAAGILWGAAQ